ncbi:MAG: hypothetical protein KBT34_05525 [Prevotella sp.]|nr:hypothetical protein [Candidatus Prevotella equi]
MADKSTMGAQLYNDWAQAFQSIGMCHISLDKCAKILAIIYDNGGNEAFTLSTRFVTDWKTAQQRLYLLGGTEVPALKADEVARGRNLVKSILRNWKIPMTQRTSNHSKSVTRNGHVRFTKNTSYQ